MEVSLKRIELNDRHILENLFPYYVYDMSEYMGWSPNSDGLYAFKSTSLDPYWTQAKHIPYFIYADKELAGFVLLRDYPDKSEVYDIEQFFVLRKFKGKGIGKMAVVELFGRYPGKWQIRVLKENTAALKFWLSAVMNVVDNNYELSLDIDVDLEMHFIRFESQLIVSSN